MDKITFSFLLGNNPKISREIKLLSREKFAMKRCILLKEESDSAE